MGWPEHFGCIVWCHNYACLKKEALGSRSNDRLLAQMHPNAAIDMPWATLFMFHEDSSGWFLEWLDGKFGKNQRASSAINNGNTVVLSLKKRSYINISRIWPYG